MSPPLRLCGESSSPANPPALAHGWHGGPHAANAPIILFRRRFLHTNLDVWMSWDPLGYPDGANT
jgi:hypothetical protein